MTLRKRLARLEDRSASDCADPAPVLIGLRAATTADVIGLSQPNGETVVRLPGETLDDLTARASMGVPRTGLPLILCCTYSNDLTREG
ncbi:MAG: hypothetical protein IT550_15390 [Novosphingobium sp.]|nr:hypothetical protein [Novosphingobium sp.]